MSNKLFHFFCAAMLASAFTSAYAEASEIKMVTQAPEGTTLRIYTMPYNDATVTGADAGYYFGEYVSKGPGTEITITGNIEQLEVYGCQLSELTVVDAPDLYILRCHTNSLKTLETANCAKLSVLDCHGNKLSVLNVEKNAVLEELNASDNELETVSFGSLPLLSKLNLASNKLQYADLTQLPAVEEMHLENNVFESLDLSGNKKVKWIYAYNNSIAGDMMTSTMADLPSAVQSPSLLYIVDTFSDTEKNVCTMADVKKAADKGWVTMDYAGGTLNSGMIGQFYPGSDYVPTISDNGVKLTTSRAAGEKVKLHIKASGDFTVEGVEETNFVSGSNTLTLTGREVFVKGDITEFECTGNDIAALTIVGTATYLKSLDCSNNSIESLDIADAPALTQIHAQKNALTHFSIKGCNAILRVDCYDNNLSGNAMKAFMESLPDGTANEPFLFVIDTKSDTEKNIATTTDVSIAKIKKWVVFDYIGGDKYGMGAEYAGSEPTGPVTPDEYFTFTTVGAAEVMVNLEYSDPDYTPVVEDAEILGWGGGVLTLRVTPGQPVKVYGDATNIGSNLSFIDTFDASACPNLTQLNLMANELTTLDVSKNTKLQNLLIFGNSLESINIEGCADLKFIICYGNRLSGAGMTDLMSTLPDRTGNDAGQIIIYDGTYSREFNVCTEDDVNIAAGRNWTTFELNAEGKPVVYGGTTGVEDITADDSAAPAEYYNLQGVRVENPANGVYIRRQGKGVSKVLVK